MPNTDVVSLFCDLVKIDSPSGAEAPMAQYLMGELTSLGFSPEVDTAGNVFCAIPGIGDPVIVAAHMDTVEPGRGIKPQVKDGFVVSDGTTILGADNKAAIAAIMAALSTVKNESRRSLELIFSVREETESGIAEFDFTRLKSSTGLIADHAAPLGSIVLSAPWIYNLHINITGKSGHASKPEKAVNALNVAALALTQTTWGRVDPTTTSNIGLISGGSAMNSIPGSVSLVGEVRSFSPAVLQQTLQQIQTVFTKVCADMGAQLEFIPHEYCTGYQHQESGPEVNSVSQVFSQVGVVPYYETVFGGSDANAFAAHAIKVVTIGDGCQYPHTVSETIATKDLETLKNLFIAYISSSGTINS